MLVKECKLKFSYLAISHARSEQHVLLCITLHLQITLCRAALFPHSYCTVLSSRWLHFTTHYTAVGRASFPAGKRRSLANRCTECRFCFRAVGPIIPDMVSASLPPFPCKHSCCLVMLDLISVMALIRFLRQYPLFRHADKH